MTVENKSPIIILGMHRSGTSCLAGTLENAGVKLGEVSNSNKYNLKGNKENSLIMSLNDDILKYNKASWDSPPVKIIWNNTHVSRAKEIINLFSTTYPDNLWGFKDPRTLLTFEFWNIIFPSATIIGSIRSPIDVTISLNKRDHKLSYKQGLSLWFQYNSILLKLVKEKKFPILSFNLSREQYLKETEKLLNYLFPDESGLNNDIFFDDELRSKDQNINFNIPKEIKDCYNELLTFLKY